MKFGWKMIRDLFGGGYSANIQQSSPSNSRLKAKFDAPIDVVTYHVKSDLRLLQLMFNELTYTHFKCNYRIKN